MKLQELDIYDAKRSPFISESLRMLGIPTEGSEWCIAKYDGNDRWDLWGATAFGLVVITHTRTRGDGYSNKIQVDGLIPWDQLGPIEIKALTDKDPDTGFATTVDVNINGSSFKVGDGRIAEDRDGVLGFLRACLAYRHSTQAR